LTLAWRCVWKACRKSQQLLFFREKDKLMPYCLSSPDRGGPPQSKLVSADPQARDCRERMGWTSENVAEEFQITREEQDAFAEESFQRAEAAEWKGAFAREIVPFNVFMKDPLTGERKLVVVSKDDGIRPGTTKEQLSRIKSAFPQWGKGTTTGGNASQITDGAAAVLLMTRKKAEELRVRILGKFITTAVTGWLSPSCFHYET
jgi:acetyl-CoA acyltransferase 1